MAGTSHLRELRSRQLAGDLNALAELSAVQDLLLDDESVSTHENSGESGVVTIEEELGLKGTTEPVKGTQAEGALPTGGGVADAKKTAPVIVKAPVPAPKPVGQTRSPAFDVSVPRICRSDLYKPSIVEKIEREPRDKKATWILGSLAFLFTAAAVWFMLWHIPGLAPFPFSARDPRNPSGTIAENLSVLWILHYALNADWSRGYAWDPGWLDSTGVGLRLDVIMGLSLFFGAFVGYKAAQEGGRGNPVYSHVKGKRLFNRPIDAIEGLRGEIATFGRGIHIHPAVSISRDRETRHFMILGAVGSGKTQVLRNIIMSILRRFKTGPEDRMIIFDNKADVTSGLPVPDDEIILFAPWDQRTWAWNVGKDILNPADASALAKRMIADSKSDPFWSNASRQIVSAVIQDLQVNLGAVWSWKELAKALRSFDHIAGAILQYNPLIAPALGIGTKEGIGKTGGSLLVNIAAYIEPIDSLCRAWDNTDPNTGREIEPGRVIPKVSLREWALTPVVNRRGIIMQGNQRYAPLQQAYIQSLIFAFGAIMNSPEMPDSSSRRIWFLLDEFPQLGKLEGFAPYLEVGRSKGLCVILGLQDLAQLKEIYGRDAADVWASIAGSYIVCRSQGVETVGWLEKFFGLREVRRVTKSWGEGRSTFSERLEPKPVVSQHDLDGLGPKKKKGILALFSPNNEHGVYRLIWPYVTFAPIRPAQVPAAWTYRIAAEKPAGPEKAPAKTDDLLPSTEVEEDEGYEEQLEDGEDHPQVAGRTESIRDRESRAAKEARAAKAAGEEDPDTSLVGWFDEDDFKV